MDDGRDSCTPLEYHIGAKTAGPCGRLLGQQSERHTLASSALSRPVHLFGGAGADYTGERECQTDCRGL